MSWPEEGVSLWRELASNRGRIALTMDEAATAELGDVIGARHYRVGQHFSAWPSPPDAIDVATALAGQRILIDLDVLFAPELHLDPVRLLHDLSSIAGGVVACWPGNITGCRAQYSRPGRADWYQADINNALVLRGREVFFPDETPFSVERIP